MLVSGATDGSELSGGNGPKEQTEDKESRMERILVRSLKLSEFNIQGFHFHIIHNLFYAKRRIIFHRSVIVLCQIQGCDWNL